MFREPVLYLVRQGIGSALTWSCLYSQAFLTPFFVCGIMSSSSLQTLMGGAGPAASNDGAARRSKTPRAAMPTTTGSAGESLTGIEETIQGAFHFLDGPAAFRRNREGRHFCYTGFFGSWT